MWGWRHPYRCLAASLLGVVGLTLTEAYTLDPNSANSIKSISRQIATDMIDTYYTGHLPGGTPGILPAPYYWWEGGAMMGALIDYWYYTGDTKFNDLVTQGLLAQVGELNDYMPRAQIMNEGNDDQGFWGVAVMAAAEYKFPDPPKDKPQWLALAQAVFNTQASRWDSETCAGGLRWQIFTWNNGFDYKNTISQGCFFNIAARLALYTGNHTYAEWAERTWNWMIGVRFIDNSYNVFDGGHVPQNCTNIVPYQWTYNAGSFLHGAAAMYNYSTGPAREIWRTRTEGLLNATHIFFTGDKKDIMTEVPCETVQKCDTDQQSFKAYLSRWMAATTKWAPWSASYTMPLLRSSAVAAAKKCSFGANGRMCGLVWTDNDTHAPVLGLGQQMAALEVTLGNMAENSTAPVTDKTGGTSVGDPSAGGGDMGRKTPSSILEDLPPMTAGDRAGAYILTIAVLLGLATGVVFVLVDETDGKTWPERWSGLRVFIVGGGWAAAPAAGTLRKTNEKGKEHERYDVDSDGSVRAAIVNRERRASSRIILDPPPPAVHHDDTAYYAEQQRRQQERRLQQSNSLHRKARSMSVIDPELGLAATTAATKARAAGYRRSASHLLERKATDGVRNQYAVDHTNTDTATGTNANINRTSHTNDNATAATAATTSPGGASKRNSLKKRSPHAPAGGPAS